ncbi:hypothetical protein Bphyt_6421 [Paraburkholderia phytofirmans PsJN]|uniref:Uncharacterized protein n=1 Tax=Paraburkholderia phytofirmans (strain DSM 17436 / LMG 22146 / PsJN) TaxID=398527 RepID=B2T8S1_PARPJ|nr:hypothetical protein Bphyt_6421 [Paraburkholderia phytofirmans PsJN]
MAHARDAATNLAHSLQTETERTFDVYELAMRDVVTVTPSVMRLSVETRWRLAFNEMMSVNRTNDITRCSRDSFV